jgi:hypothetical protein
MTLRCTKIEVVTHMHTFPNVEHKWERVMLLLRLY